MMIIIGYPSEIKSELIVKLISMVDASPSLLFHEERRNVCYSSGSRYVVV